MQPILPAAITHHEMRCVTDFSEIKFFRHITTIFFPDDEDD